LGWGVIHGGGQEKTGGGGGDNGRGCFWKECVVKERPHLCKSLTVNRAMTAGVVENIVDSISLLYIIIQYMKGECRLAG